MKTKEIFIRIGKEGDILPYRLKQNADILKHLARVQKAVKEPIYIITNNPVKN